MTARRSQLLIAVLAVAVIGLTFALVAGRGRTLASTPAASPTVSAQPASPAPAGTARQAYTPPKIGHVWTIILENKSYEATFSGLNRNSYLWRTLPTYGALLRQYYATGHYSLPNYISLVSGQSPAPDNQADCPRYHDVSPGTAAPDGQTYASTGCVYPKAVRTLFNQLTQAHRTWKVYAQDMGNDPARERAYQCGIPGDPSGAGVVSPGVATPGVASISDQYVVKHNPAAWFHAIIDDPAACKNVVPLDGLKASAGHAAVPSLADDLRTVATTPAFSWITPNNCSDAHDATCRGDNLSGDPGNHQGGLYAADLFLQRWVPAIMASPAYKADGEIQIIFDEALPPYKMYGNSIADYTGNSNPALNTPTDTAQSIVACCNELPGPNTTQPGFQAFGQDTTPGGGITGAVFISRFIRPGSVSDQPYNHYSWLRSTEDLFGLSTGGTDRAEHLGYAAAEGLRPFAGDVYSNPSGTALAPAPSGSWVFPATASLDQPSVPRVTALGAATVRSGLLAQLVPDVSVGHPAVLAIGGSVRAALPAGAAAVVTALGPELVSAPAAGTSTRAVITLRVDSGAVPIAAADLTARDDSGQLIALTPVSDTRGGGQTFRVSGTFSAGAAQLTWRHDGRVLAVWTFTIELD